MDALKHCMRTSGPRWACVPVDWKFTTSRSRASSPGAKKDIGELCVVHCCYSDVLCVNRAEDFALDKQGRTFASQKPSSAEEKLGHHQVPANFNLLDPFCD